MAALIFECNTLQHAFDRLTGQRRESIALVWPVDSDLVSHSTPETLQKTASQESNGRCHVSAEAGV